MKMESSSSLVQSSRVSVAGDVDEQARTRTQTKHIQARAHRDQAVPFSVSLWQWQWRVGVDGSGPTAELEWENETRRPTGETGQRRGKDKVESGKGWTTVTLSAERCGKDGNVLLRCSPATYLRTSCLGT